MRVIARSLCVAALFVFASVFLAPKAEAVPQCEPTTCEVIARGCGQMMLPYQDSNEEFCGWITCDGKTYAFAYREYQCGPYSGQCLSGYIYNPEECSDN